MAGRQKGFGVIEILVCVAVIGILGTVGWLLYQRTQSQPATVSTTKPDTSQKSTSSALMPDTVIDSIKKSLAGQYELQDLDTNNQPSAGQLGYRITNTSPLYKVGGYSFYSDYKGGAAIEMSVGPYSTNPPTLPPAGDVTVRKLVANTFTSQKLTKKETRGINDGTMNTQFDVYEGQGLTCTIQSIAEQSTLSSASCGEISKYTATAATLKPIVAAIPDATSDSISFSNVDISDSPTQGYKRAKIGVGDVNGIGGHIALLYKTPDGAWKYLMGTQNELMCADFAASDVRAAFRGMSCLGAQDTQTTVQ